MTATCHGIGGMVIGSNAFVCSRCKCELRVDVMDVAEGSGEWQSTLFFGRRTAYPRYCPVCGRRVVRMEDDEAGREEGNE